MATPPPHGWRCSPSCWAWPACSPRSCWRAACAAGWGNSPMLSINVSLARGEFRLAVNFEAATPGVIALFGHSGCGKSTVVNLLAGLIGGAQGRITLDEETWFDSRSGINVPTERRRIGYV